MAGNMYLRHTLNLQHLRERIAKLETQLRAMGVDPDIPPKKRKRKDDRPLTDAQQRVVNAILARGNWGEQALIEMRDTGAIPSPGEIWLHYTVGPFAGGITEGTKVLLFAVSGLRNILDWAGLK